MGMEVAIFIINSITGSKLFYIELSTEYYVLHTSLPNYKV